MAITKLEKDTISAIVSRNKDESKHYVTMADKSQIMINKESNSLLSLLTMMYNRENGTKHGKGFVLNELLQEFAKDQPAIFKLAEIDLKAYQSSVLNAIQQSKGVFRKFVSDDITQASDVVYAICMYHIIHRWEVASGIRVTDFRDDQYEDEHDPKMEPLDGVEDYSKLGKRELKKLASLSTTPKVQPINPPPFIVQPVVKPPTEPPQPVSDIQPDKPQIKISEPVADPLPPVQKQEPIDTAIPREEDEPDFILPISVPKPRPAPIEPDHAIDDLDLFEDSEDEEPEEEPIVIKPKPPAPIKEEPPMTRQEMLRKIRERQTKGGGR